MRWSDAHFGYRVGHPKARPVVRQARQRAGHAQVPRRRPGLHLGRRPRRRARRGTTPSSTSCTCTGFTMRHPDVPPQLRGTYAGLATAPVIDHLLRLGVTAVELMPVHAFVDDRHLLEKGLRNYWGYNTIGFFAPDMRYSRDAAAISEFKTMVKTLHSAGIEVILDVVYNHTAEGNHLGPTLSLPRHRQRLLLPPRRRRSALLHGLHRQRQHAQHAASARAAAASWTRLRYWVQEMHVDGFRFDLASALARELHDVDRLGSFFDTIHQDPVLSQVKLIAEPWDVGEGGYQVGNFPPGWTEWNDKYRDTVRAYWKGDGGLIGEFARRFTGSARSLRAERPQAAREHQLRHRARRLHAARSRQLQRASTTRRTARTTATATTTTSRGTAAPKGPTDDPDDQRAARAAEAQPDRDAAALAGRADAARRRRARPHAERQQQRLLPGQRDLLARLDARPTSERELARVRARA